MSTDGNRRKQAEERLRKQDEAREQREEERRRRRLEHLKNLAAPRSTEDLLSEHAKDRAIRRLRAERKQLLLELSSAEARLDLFDRLAHWRPKPITKREKTSGLREATAVALGSDWHVEEPVHPETVNGMNHYNLQIAKERIGRFIRGIRWLLEKERSKFKIRDLVLALLGDLMTGDIHDELEVSAELQPLEVMLWLVEELGGVIDSLLEDPELERIVIPCSYGNHGRIHRKKRIHLSAKDNREWLIYCLLAQRYEKNPRVDFQVAGGILNYLDVYDYLIRFTHGDDVKFWGGVGGLQIPLMKAIKAWDSESRADVTCLGHYHTYQALPRAVVNGSLIGYSALSQAFKFEYEAPRQAFFLLDKNEGACCHTPIWVERSDD